MRPRSAIAVLAGLVLLVGLVLGFVPHTITDFSPVSPVHCGSAFVPSNEAAATDLGSASVGVSTSYAQQCSALLGTPRVFALSLVGVGVLVLLFLALTARRSVPAVSADRTQEQYAADDGEY